MTQHEETQHLAELLKWQAECILRDPACEPYVEQIMNLHAEIKRKNRLINARQETETGDTFHKDLLDVLGRIANSLDEISLKYTGGHQARHVREALAAVNKAQRDFQESLNKK